MAQINGSPTTSGEIIEEKKEPKRSLENASDPWAAVKHMRIRSGKINFYLFFLLFKI